MRLVIPLCALLLLAAFVPTADASPNTFPVCKDKDVRAGPYVWVHVGIDCEPGIWVESCVPGRPCVRHDVRDLLA